MLGPECVNLKYKIFRVLLATCLCIEVKILETFYVFAAKNQTENKGEIT